MASFLPLRSSRVPHLQFGPKNPGYDSKRRRGPPQPQHCNTIHIYKAIPTPPFLQFTALTPGQKRYLWAVCEAYSEDHIRKLMQQHYLNVLYRSIESDAQKSSFTFKPAIRTSLPGLDHSTAAQDEKDGHKTKGQVPKNTSPETKTACLPEINSHRQRVSRIKHKVTNQVDKQSQ